MSRLPFRVNRISLRPGSREEIRRWAAETNARSAEVEETLRAEGIQLELVLFEEREEGDSLYFVMQTGDYQRAIDVFMASTRPVDIAHRAFLERISQDSHQLEVLACHYAGSDGEGSEGGEGGEGQLASPATVSESGP
ncbi:MAG TPA: DUF6176 family protein [Rubrivivax sp.]|nr:DUF6176 family protein [Rubrivivax sp.]